MATQWGPGSLHPKCKIRASLLQEVFFIFVGVSDNGHYTARAQESLLDSGATLRHFSFWEGRGLITSMLLW